MKRFQMLIMNKYNYLYSLYIHSSSSGVVVVDCMMLNMLNHLKKNSKAAVSSDYE